MSARAKRQARDKVRCQRALQKELRRRARRAMRPGAAGAAAALALSMTGVGTAEAADHNGTVEPSRHAVPGVDSINPQNRAAAGDSKDAVTVGGILYFTADDGATGDELWKSDGTAAGTVLVKDINPAPRAATPSRLTAVGGTLFFTADDGSPRPGAVEVRRHRRPAPCWSRTSGPAASSGYPDDLTAVGGTLFFTADDGSTAASCGSPTAPPAGTVLVKDIIPGGAGTQPSARPDRGRRHAVLHRRRRRARPRAVEVRRHRRRAPSWSRTSGPALTAATPYDLTAVGRHAVLHRRRRRPRPRAVEVRRHRRPARCWSRTSSPAATAADPGDLTAVGGTLFFTADDGMHGSELWKSDGTDGGHGPGQGHQPRRSTAATPPT